jgi:cytochrome bd-type quinol oxidase subunit 2
MKKKLSKLLVLGLLFPLITFAQWAEPASTNLPSNTINAIVTNIMNWLLILLGAFGVIGFVVSGIFYLTAAGRDDQMESAKKAMQWSIIGIIVGLMGLVVIKAAEAMLDGAEVRF